MMAESTLHDYEYVVIHGVSPTAYQRVLEAVGHCHLRHTYDHGDLEILRRLGSGRLLTAVMNPGLGQSFPVPESLPDPLVVSTTSYESNGENL